MTPLKKPVSRATAAELDGTFGPDRGRRLVVTLVPGKEASGDRAAVPDLIRLRPMGTRRAEEIAAVDVYLFALRSRVNREQLARMRERKAALAEARAEASRRRAELRLRREARRDRRGDA